LVVVVVANYTVQVPQLTRELTPFSWREVLPDDRRCHWDQRPRRSLFFCRLFAGLTPDQFRWSTPAFLPQAACEWSEFPTTALCRLGSASR